jgi:MoxR-like ATPase
MLLSAKAMAFLAGQCEVEVEDLHRVVHPTLRHRLVLSYHAEAERLEPDRVIDQVLESLPDGLYRKAAPAPRRKGLLARLLGRC